VVFCLFFLKIFNIAIFGTDPIAMSVRSTNVYEEQSLGVFHEQALDEENTFEPSGPRLTVWSRYLAMHARKQLAFGMYSNFSLGIHA